MSRSLLTDICPSHLQRAIYSLLSVDSLSEFSEGLVQVMRSLLPLHSLRVSLNTSSDFDVDLTYDTLRIAEDCSEERRRYFTARHRVDPTVGFVSSHAGVALSSTSMQLGGAERLKAQSFFRDYMCHEGWDKDAEIYFWAPHDCAGYICLRRSAEQPQFTTCEWTALRELRGILEAVIVRLRNATRERVTMAALSAVAEGSAGPVLIFDDAMRVLYASPTARRRAHSIALLRDEDSPGLTVAAHMGRDIEQWCHTARHDDSICRASGGELASVCHLDGPTETLRLELIPTVRHFCGNVFVLRFPAERTEMPAARCAARVTSHPPAFACLSPREREVAVLMREGLSNKAIAQRLHKSLPTVKMQVQSILRKLHVDGRIRVALM